MTMGNEKNGMESIEELEKRIFVEIEAKGRDTFMHLLNTCGVFDELKFDDLICRIDCLANLYGVEGKTDNYKAIANGIMTLFEHTIFLFYCHESNEDGFEIETFKGKPTAETVSNFYERIRQSTRLLLSL